MVRPLVYILPAFALGAGAGLFAGGSFRSPAKKVISGSTDSSALTQARTAADDSGIDYDKLAAVCVEAARSQKGSAQRGAGEPVATSAEASKAYAMLTQVEESALTSGVWTRIAGFKAQTLLPRLPSEQGREFSERIGEQIRTGALRPQSGAWLPGSTEQ